MKVILFIFLLFISLTIQAHPVHRKLHHQNVIFQKFLNSSLPSKGKFSKTFAPKGQYIFLKIF